MTDLTVSNIDAEPQSDPYGRWVYSELDRQAIQQLLDSDAALTPRDTKCPNCRGRGYTETGMIGDRDRCFQCDGTGLTPGDTDE